MDSDTSASTASTASQGGPTPTPLRPACDRHAAAWPALLSRLLAIAADPSPAGALAAADLLVRGPAEAREDWQELDPANGWLSDDAPSQQMHRLAAAVLQAFSPSWLGGLAQAVPQALPPGDAGVRLALRSRWLQQAATALALDPARADILPPGGATCRLRVLLHHLHTGHGLFGVLQLRAVPASPGAHLALVAAPGSAFTPCSASFHGALQQATAWLRAVTAADATRDIALAWDIHAPAEQLEGLDGPSAGAAVALAGAWLLQDHLLGSQASLRQALASIQPWMLAEAGVSAMVVDARGNTAGVGAAAPKAGALHSATQDGGLLHLFLHAGDVPGLQALALPRLVLHPITDLLDLATRLARSVQPDADRAAVLSRLPLDRPPADPTDDTNPPPDVPAALLQALVKRGAEVRSLADYALHRWASWAVQDGGMLHLRFVPLQLAHLGDRPGSGAGMPFKGLVDLLGTLRGWPPDRHQPTALLLRGAAGAGKSTLLQQHEMGLALDVLRHWHQRAAGSSTAAVQELPLYVALRSLPATAPDALAWLQRKLADEHPQCHDLHTLLRGEVVHGQPQLRLRLLLDGLNELPVPPNRTRKQRAEAVLAQLAAGLPGRLPPLLCARSQHGFENLVQDSGMAVDVQAWDDARVEKFVHRFFAGQPGHGQAMLDALARNPAARALCHTPFNARGQCALWRQSGQLAAHRAALYRQLLRQALLRELAIDPLTNNAVNPLFGESDALLTPDDRTCLLDDTLWGPDSTPPWPTQGPLLRGLFAQALAQWRDAGGSTLAVPAHERGLVEVPWDHPDDPDRSVLAGWPEALRQEWRQAVDDLGLLAPGCGKGGQAFAFRHQSWGEYLASVALLTPMPQQMPPADQQRLRADLQAGRGFARSPEAELAHQQGLADERWREPGDAFWAGLFSQPLDLDLAHTVQRLREGGYTAARVVLRPGIAEAAMSDWQQAIAAGVVQPDEAGNRCLVHLQRWGDRFNIAGRSGQPPDSWTQQPAAWRVLVLQSLPEPMREHIFALLGDTQAQRLQQQAGRLQLATAGDLDEVLGLALLALPKSGCRAWLAWLLQQGLWPALQPALADLQRRLEGGPRQAWQAPDAVLQHLRRLLLLHLLDAGSGARAGVQASGQLDLLPEDLPPAALQGLPLALQVGLAADWQQQRQAAFGAGHDVRQRLLAGRLLGELGDTLRLQPAPAACGTGLRLHPALWATVGRPGRPTRFAIGSPSGQPDTCDNEAPVWQAKLPRQPGAWLQAARLPVTCAEWRWFVDAGGYTAEAPHWADAAQGAGPAARAWLAEHPRTEPLALAHANWGNGLNPVTTITLFEAMAYAAWAAPMYAADNPDTQHWQPPQLRPPTEVEWEAAQRAGADGLPPKRPLHWPASGRPPQPMDFNHAATGWRQPSPVGAFALAYSAGGLADGAGNVWEWCVNSLPQGPRAYSDPGSQDEAQSDWQAADGSTLRALRGGAFHYDTIHCRPALRLQIRPGYLSLGFGVRLVRLWLPHSEPRTP